ncbi:MAG: alpha-amylase family glycosyl hydrolase [bacterium]
METNYDISVIRITGFLTQHTPYSGHFEFHVARKARIKYQFEEAIFTTTGNVIFADFSAARTFAQRMNKKRDVVAHPEHVVRAGEINALGLIDEILHNLVAQYRQKFNERTFEEALHWLEGKAGADEVEKTLHTFVEEFPPLAVYKQEIDVQTYLNGVTAGIPNRQIALEEMLLLWLANLNPAFSPFLELFDDQVLEKQTIYLDIMRSLHDFFETQPRFGPDNENLIDAMRGPALASPHSLEGQLRFLQRKWRLMLEHFGFRFLRGFDFIKEESKPVFAGHGPAEVIHFDETQDEPEQFSPDLEWMPKLVLIAKSTLVWLDQLSKKYRRAITRLDHIPDEELDQLARWGFTGLWLIGVWERSSASKEIKRMSGNPEAEASAYSLFDYDISAGLGGYESLKNLQERCWQRGIRLASDMVPNHTGLESRWVREHPDWFVSLQQTPFPSYTFTGPNYSTDPRYGIFIEDKYYDRTDAAVVFKREDTWTGDVRYIYHGNDGTNMPWNDTAQLNFLNPEVREAVIQKILHVSRLFPIIRFDAAMTLAKRHYQRLWFPEPGGGGDIPSRAEFGLTKAEFNSAMPNEFWREVVDRVAQESPDTLLLAEAFWLMEGYFVRSLGMHRVYNSAFMNMLKSEENQKYRETLKNTLQFNPEILKRYVHFMNNPDEETAALQFGRGDKYFGICMMMVTLPGLPMFGHGQIEGFREKYGMEYRRAYLDEVVDTHLVQRHEREIFPLMKKRYLFAEVDNFLLYDFFIPQGTVNENVFAYSNRLGEERALIIYNNKFEETRGWIRYSAAYAVKTGVDRQVRLIQKSLGQGLEIYHNQDYFCLFRDHVSGLEYIRNCRGLCEQGLYVEIGAYKYHVFVDFRQIRDNEDKQHEKLNAYLNGRGVLSLSEELVELSLKPLLDAFDALCHEDMVNQFLQEWPKKEEKKPQRHFIVDFKKKYSNFMKQAYKFSDAADKKNKVSQEVVRKLKNLWALDSVGQQYSLKSSRNYQSALKYLNKNLEADNFFLVTAYTWLLVHAVGKVQSAKPSAEQSHHLLDDWLLCKRVDGVINAFVADDEKRWEGKYLVRILTRQQEWFKDLKSKKQNAHRTLETLLRSDDVQQFLKVNRFNETLWFNKERAEQLFKWLFLIAVVQIISQVEASKERIAKEISECFTMVHKWSKAQESSQYQVTRLLDLLKEKAPKKRFKQKDPVVRQSSKMKQEP